MQRTSTAPVPSLRFFQEYCATLLELRDLAAQPPPVEDPAEQSSASAPAAGPSTDGKINDLGAEIATQRSATAVLDAPPLGRPRAIWNQLARLIDQQLIESSRIAGPLGLEFHRDAVYAMAALTDEIFVHLEWEGREFWLSHLLEARFFQSHFAGEKLFRRIDDLLVRDDDPAGELAAVYLSTLALGFRGRYWGSHHDAVIDDYRKRLFYFISRRTFHTAEPDPRLFPEAYGNVIQDGVIRGIPQPRRWFYIFAGFVVAWLIATYVIWYNLTADLKQRLCCLSNECSQACGAVSPGPSAVNKP